MVIFNSYVKLPEGTSNFGTFGPPEISPPPFLPQVLIAAHGNSLRALVKILDNVPEDAEHGSMAGARQA